MINFVAFEQGKYQSVLESGDQEQLQNLLSAVPSMPEHEVKFLMFSASLPNVSILRENLALTYSPHGKALLDVLTKAIATRGGADHA